jgi:predicted secreted protein
MMKKLIITFTALMAAILLVGFLIGRIRKADSKESYLEKSTQIELKVNEQHTFMLKGLGSAGYSWTWTIDGDDKAVEVSIGPSSALPPTPEGGLPPNNYSIDEVVTILARAPGHVTIHFAQRRDWEKDTPPLREFDLGITVVR